MCPCAHPTYTRYQQITGQPVYKSNTGQCPKKTNTGECQGNKSILIGKITGSGVNWNRDIGRSLVYQGKYHWSGQWKTNSYHLSLFTKGE